MVKQYAAQQQAQKPPRPIASAFLPTWQQGQQHERQPASRVISTLDRLLSRDPSSGYVQLSSSKHWVQDFFQSVMVGARQLAARAVLSKPAPQDIVRASPVNRIWAPKGPNPNPPKKATVPHLLDAHPVGALRRLLGRRRDDVRHWRTISKPAQPLAHLGRATVGCAIKGYARWRRCSCRRRGHGERLRRSHE